MRRFAILLVLTSTARADVRLDLDVDGGAEAGTIARSVPSLVGETGMTVSYRPRASVFGVAADIDGVYRASMPYGAVDELRSDLMVLVADPEGRGHITLGAGFRVLSFLPPESPHANDLIGYDLVHLGIAMQLVGWDFDYGRVEVDAHGSFTFGCYQGKLRAGDIPDMPARSVTCTSMVSTTYVAGIGIAFSTGR